MKNKIISLVIILFILSNNYVFSDDYEISKKMLTLINLSSKTKIPNFSSYGFRFMCLFIPLDVYSPFLEDYIKNSKTKNIKEKATPIIPFLKKTKIEVTSPEKIITFLKDVDSFFVFKIRKRVAIMKELFLKKKFFQKVYFLKEHKLVYYKDVIYDYMNSWGDDIIGIRGRKYRKVYLLNKNLEKIKTYEHRSIILPKDVVKKGDRIYFHKKRYKRGEPAVEIMERGKIKYYFNKTQSSKDELEDVAVMDDTVFSMGESCFYISFTYPEDNFIRIYKYTDTGKLFEIKVNIEDEYFGAPKYWNNLVRFKRRIIYDIASVNGIYEGKKYLYIATGRNKIEKGIDTNLRDYLYVLSRDGRYYYGRIKLRHGTPVYYDRDTGWFYSVRLKTYFEKDLWRWKVEVING